MKNILFLSLFNLILHAHLIAQKMSNMSLNGEWEIIFDDDNSGRQDGWMRSDNFQKHPHKTTIQVPSAWETVKMDYEGVAFYRKKFNVPADWFDKIVRVHFGAVNYLSEIWLNDEVVGYHEGGFTPFEFRIDEMLKVDEVNILILRVVGPIILSDKEVDGIRKMEVPQWRGGITGGIWQDVELVATGNTYVDDVYIKPNIHENTTSIMVELNHTAIRGIESTISIKTFKVEYPSKIIASIKKNWALRPGRNVQTWKLKIPNAYYWSPDHPHLYSVKIEVSNEGIITDTWEGRFGMRELTIKDKDFYLNGKRIHLKASFFEGLYPNGIAYPDNEAMVRKEIALAKQAGFNMIRPWRRPPAPMWLDLADELGIMVVGSPALECMTLPVSTPYLPYRVENEVRESILRDRNRACIVQWELFNELHRPILKQLMRPMAMLARNLDATRLILDESGGWAYGANMYLPNEYEPTKFNDIHNYAGPFINKYHYEGYLSIGLTEEEKKAKGYQGSRVGRNVVPGLMSYVSELGYGSLPDLTKVNLRFEKYGNPLTPAYRYHQRLAEEQAQIIDESGFSSLYPDLRQFYLDQQNIHGAANKRMLEAVRANPNVDGYCIHALIGGDWVLGAGIIDLWRGPKGYAYEATKAANQPQIVSIRLNHRNVYASQGTTLEVIGINELDPTSVDMYIEIRNKKGKTVYRNSNSLNWQHGVSTLFKSDLETKKWNGNYTVEVSLETSDGNQLTKNNYPFDVFREKDLTINKTTVALLDFDNPLATFLKQKGIQIEKFSPNTDLSIPVFVTNANVKPVKDKVDFTELFEFIRKGGTTIYIEGVRNSIDNELPAFPFLARVHPARGLWTCIPHLVKSHKIFDGLPSNCMMRDIYENVWPLTTLRDLRTSNGSKIETIVASIGFDWFSREHKMHYSGPGSSWWGSDFAILSIGEGRCLISQLRLLENLNQDPVADKILLNILSYLKS